MRVGRKGVGKLGVNIYSYAKTRFLMRSTIASVIHRHASLFVINHERRGRDRDCWHWGRSCVIGRGVWIVLIHLRIMIFLESPKRGRWGQPGRQRPLGAPGTP